MRYALALIGLLAAFTVHATPRGTVISYECEQIAPADTGVSCRFDKGELSFRWHGDPKQMDAARVKRGTYEIHRLGLHFMQLGGTFFEVRSDGWAPRTKQLCLHHHKKPFYSYSCSMCTENENGEC